ncbi:MAG: hypothetical protein MUC60_10065 [Oscillatoria sp. Prado101]|nr:hypothetical protein [Oscillatoria sp. Prado101]
MPKVVETLAARAQLATPRATGTSGSQFGCNWQSAIGNPKSCRFRTGFGD